MFAFERIAAGYFLLLAAGAAVAPVPRRRALQGAAASLAAGVLITITVPALPIGARIGLPLLYLPLAYWLPATLAPAPAESRFERWLRRHDTAWRRHLAHLPPAATVPLELAYTACYLIVPLAFVAVWRLGTLEQVNRFWAAVLISGFSCYITLPWLVSRPPRMLDDDPQTRPGAATFNVSLLRRVSHELNTFPSGHVAVAIAVALTVMPVSRVAGLLFGILATGIAAGAAAGRYHYGVDVLVGAIVGLAGCGAAWLITGGAPPG